MSTSKKQKGISSAEITAVYRSAIPVLSGDKLSEELVTPEGKEKAAEFITKYDYPLG